MTVIGVDFSLNSTGITIHKDNTYIFYNIFNQTVKDFNKSEKYRNHRMISNYVNLIPINRNIDKTTYQTQEYDKLVDADKLTNTIIEIVSQWEASSTTIIIEGFSFGSKSNSYIDLVEYQSILRFKLQSLKYNLVILSPSEIKKAVTGKGNAKKEDVIKAVIKEIGESNDFIRFIKNNQKNFTKDIKPIDDICDSLAITLSFEHKIKFS